MEKYNPIIGEHCFLRQFTGNYYVDMVKRPYTVISVSNNKIIVQEAKLIFPIFKYDPNTMSEYYKEFDGQRVSFYDTIAESIEEDPEGRIEELTWHKKRELWGTPGSDRDYPEYAIFGKGWLHQPYLD